MKRHHIVAVLCLISGGLFAYIQFHHGDTDRAIRTGTICILLGVVAFLFGKLRSWLRPVGVTVPLIILGLLAAHAAFTGDIASAIFLCAGLILAGFDRRFQTTSFVKVVKEKSEPYAGMIILLIVTLFLLFTR